MINSNYIAEYFSENHLTWFPPAAQAKDQPRRWMMASSEVYYPSLPGARNVKICTQISGFEMKWYPSYRYLLLKINLKVFKDEKESLFEERIPETMTQLWENIFCFLFCFSENACSAIQEASTTLLTNN